MDSIDTVWDKVWAEKSIENAANTISLNSADLHVKTHLPFVNELLATFEDSLILEAGCGTGEWVFYVEKLKNYCVGIDLAKITLQNVQGFASKRNSTTAFVLGDIRNLPFSSNSFDYVLSFGVIEHFPDPSALLSNMFRILKPSGKALITTPNVFSSHTIMRPISKFLGKWNLAYESYSPKALMNLIERFGFRIEKRGVMPGGEIFGSAPKYIPLIGPSLYNILSRISLLTEKKTNLLGFWSYVIAEKPPDKTY